MKESQLNNILRLIVDEYKGIHGDSIGELNRWSFSGDLFDKNKDLEKIVLKASPEPIQKRKYVHKALSHLITEGFILDKNGGYFLTHAGLIAGSQGLVKRLLEFLNRNPGLALVVSFLALIVSILALYVSYAKP